MNARVFVAGHAGLVGSALVRALKARGKAEILTVPRSALDLENQQGVFEYFERERPEYVYLAAAKVGGIVANMRYPADFIRSNLSIQCNVIEAAWRSGVRKLLFLGSACVYPRFAKQPITEDQLLTGPLEPTNAAYSVAKIAGIEMCRAYNEQRGTNFISVMQTNLYGPGDNFDPETSHVLPALIRKFDNARQRRDASVTLWGSGQPRREFLHVDDMASASLLLMDRYEGSDPINIGCGEDLTINELAGLVKHAVGYEGSIEWDVSRPDGMPRRLLNVSKLLAFGWRPQIPLDKGIASTYEWYLANK